MGVHRPLHSRKLARMTNDATDPPVRYELLGTVVKAQDLLIAVRVAVVEGERVIDVRDYVPSIDFYGRGITIPTDASVEVAQLIASARTR
jgi:hypothetical protein